MDWLTLNSPNPLCRHYQSQYHNTLFGSVIHWCPDCAVFVCLHQCGSITSSPPDLKCSEPSSENVILGLDTEPAVKPQVGGGGQSNNGEKMRYRELVRNFKKQILEQTINECNGNLCKAARSLGIHRNSIRREMAVLGVVRRVGAKRIPESVVSGARAESVNA